MGLTGGHGGICVRPPLPFSPSMTVCVCVCEGGSVCVLSCQQGCQTPVVPHWGTLTLSLLDFLHPNIPPPDIPYVTPLLFFSPFSPLLRKRRTS